MGLGIAALSAGLWAAGARAAPVRFSSHLGIAYQTWNKPLGIWQTPEELSRDLDAMAKLGVKSLRVEFVWNVLEPRPGQFDFSLPELLVAQAKARGMTLYPIIGFQWPPDWFEAKHRLGLMSAPGAPTEYSSIMNYADPYVRGRFARLIGAVVSHFKGEKTIAGWILGNEFTYMDFGAERQLGYDPGTARAFRDFLRRKYGSKDAASAIPDLQNEQDVLVPAVADFLDYRRHAIAAIVGTACAAAKQADPDARRIYSAIGVLYSQFDTRGTSEDWSLIADECRRRGAPLDLFALNSYLNLNSYESFNLGLSAELARAATGLEPIFTEFGLSSTEAYAEIDEKRQAKFLKAQYLETIIDGLGQAHIFTWLDKTAVSDREKGFGLVTAQRRPKPALREMESLQSALSRVDVARLAGDVIRPRHAVAFLMPDPATGFPHWESWLDENWIVASYLRRFDVPVVFLKPSDLSDPAKLEGVELLVLCRQQTLRPRFLREILQRLDEGRFHVLAVSGMPGSESGEAEAARPVAEKIWGLELLGESPGGPSQRFPVLASTEGQERGHPVEYVSAVRTWKIEDLKPLDALSVPSLSSRIGFDSPLYYTRSHRARSGAKKAVYVRMALGYTDAMDLDPGPRSLIDAERARNDARGVETKVLASLTSHSELLGLITADLVLGDLGLGSVFHATHDSPQVPGALPLNRVRALKGGGHLVLLQAMPVFRFYGARAGAPCGDWTQSFAIGGLGPREKLVPLAGAGASSVQADASGELVYRLKSCESELLLTDTARARYANVSADAFEGTR